MQRDRLVTGSQSQPVGDCLGHQHPVEGVRRQSRERGSRELAEAHVPYLLGEIGRSGEFPGGLLDGDLPPRTCTTKPPTPSPPTPKPSANSASQPEFIAAAEM